MTPRRQSLTAHEEERTPRILSLITHFSHIPQWESCTTRIDLLDPHWKDRSLFFKALTLARLASEWDRIVFFYDVRLPVVFAALFVLLYGADPRKRMIFTTWLCDIARFRESGAYTRRGLYELLRKGYFWVFVRLFRLIVVHSNTERTLYAGAFGVPVTRFRFIPYFARSDSMASARRSDASLADYILAAGRNRDYQTFVAAVQDLGLRAVLIAGAGDTGEINKLPSRSNVEIHVEVPFECYRDWIRNAEMLVIPLFSSRCLRSLGQLAALEAVVHRVPVIAARTFQLQEYFLEDEEVFFYEPENSADLRRAILRLRADAALRRSLTENAYRRLEAQYTPERYTCALLEACSC